MDTICFACSQRTRPTKRNEQKEVDTEQPMRMQEVFDKVQERMIIG